MRQSVVKGKLDYWRQRDEIAKTVEQKMGGHRRGSNPAPATQARFRPTVQGECKRHCSLCGKYVV